MNNKIKIALIGCGNWGKNIARNLYEMDCLACIYDPNSLQAKEFIISHKLPICSLNEIFLNEDITAVVIATSARTHKEIAIQALINNKDVFIEKPFSLSLSDANLISKLAITKNKILMVGHLLNYHNSFLELKKIIKEGKIGSIKNIRAQRLALGSIRNYESVLYDLTVHDISMILSITQALPLRALAHSIHHNSNVGPDAVSVTLYFKDGITAVLNSDWMCPYKEHRFSVIGTKGSLIFDDTKNWDSKLSLNQSSINLDNTINLKNTKSLIVKKNEPLKVELESFLKSIQSRTIPVTDHEEALNVQIVMEMIENNLKKNKA